jgi:hypothetical protein
MTTAVAPPEPVLDSEPAKTEDPALLRAVHTPNFTSLLRFETAVQEVFAVTVLPGKR